jgi:hypothetical protein
MSVPVHFPALRYYRLVGPGGQWPGRELWLPNTSGSSWAFQDALAGFKSPGIRRLSLESRFEVANDSDAECYNSESYSIQVCSEINSAGTVQSLRLASSSDTVRVTCTSTVNYHIACGMLRAAQYQLAAKFESGPSLSGCHRGTQFETSTTQIGTE